MTCAALSLSELFQMKSVPWPRRCVPLVAEPALRPQNSSLFPPGCKLHYFSQCLQELGQTMRLSHHLQMVDISGIPNCQALPPKTFHTTFFLHEGDSKGTEQGRATT